MRKILITWIAGYIGSHVSNMLVEKGGYEIHGLDKKKSQVPLYKHYYQDIRDTHWDMHDSYDCVIHLAAEVAVGRSINNPILYYTTNTIGTLNVLRNITTKRFIHASTGSAGPMNNPYGISKRSAEQIVEQYCSENDIPYTTFRFYNVTGSNFGIYRPDTLLSKLIEAEKTGEFNLFGNDYNTEDGTAVRDYTHVDEICNAVSQAIDQSTNQIENLGHGVGTTVMQMVNMYKKVNQCDFEVKICPRRVGDLERSVLDNPSAFMQKLYTIEELLKVS